jgi:hypothetical protein
MNLKTQLQGITAGQSSTIGWKECVCSKTNSTTNLRLTVSGGNPEFYFTTFQEEMLSDTNGAGMTSIAWTIGWRVNTSGGIDNPTGNGACNFIPWQKSWNNSGWDWSFWDVATSTITWRSSGGATINTIHRVLVYSERIDLITLSCV